MYLKINSPKEIKISSLRFALFIAKGELKF
jgi:hypothetical protein